MVGFSLANAYISVGARELLSSGTVIFGANETLVINLKEGGEELTFEIVVKRSDPAQPKPSTLSLDLITTTKARFIFNDTPEGASAYEAAIGSISDKISALNFLSRLLDR
jgi:hypothetical protein